MCHSFSFGTDAKTGMNFETKRTKNRHLNKIVYGVEGAKLFFSCAQRKKETKIKHILHSLNRKKVNNFTSNSSEGSDNNAKIEDQTSGEDVLIAADNKTDSKYYLSGEPTSFY
jgi:hypothetical protein